MEYKRRLDAAVALNGTTLDEVDAALAAEWGLGKEAASRPGRTADKAKPTKVLSHALGEILGVGEKWFEVEDWRNLIKEGADAAGLSAEEIGDLKGERSSLLSTIALVRDELEALRKHPPPP